MIFLFAKLFFFVLNTLLSKNDMFHFFLFFETTMDDIDWTSDPVRFVFCCVGLACIPPLTTQGKGGSNGVDIVVGLLCPCYIMPMFGCWAPAPEGDEQKIEVELAT
jgi:hypothetical protein